MMTFFRAKATFPINAGDTFEVNTETCETVKPNGRIHERAVASVERAQLVKTGDAVNHPSHYNAGKIEVIEFIEDQKLNYHIGNVVKYLARAGKKDAAKTIEDLKKAHWYLGRYIELISAEAEGREPVRPNQMVRK